MRRNRRRPHAATVDLIEPYLHSPLHPLPPSLILPHLLHLCFLSKLRPARALEISACGHVLTGRKYSLSLKPNQRLSHPHTLFFSETPITATCSTFPIPHPPLHCQGPPIVPPIFSKLHHFSTFLTESLYI